MLKLLVVTAVVGIVASEVTLQQVFQQHWNGFKSRHNKEYSGEEEQQRINQFIATSYMIESHNEKYARGEVSFKMGHNHMSDMDMKEIEEKYMGYQMPPPRAMENATFYKPSLRSYQVPQSIDWRTWNLVGPVKNQGTCASCYTFSAVATLETQVARKTGKLIRLSEQQLVDCTKEYGNYACGGGYMNSAYQYIRDNGGIVLEEDYPYKGTAGTCRAKEFKPHDTIRDFIMIAKYDEKTMAEAVSTVGPLAVAYWAGNRDFALYSEGVYDRDECPHTYLSHAVTIVGYGTENGKDFWIVKNSWGPRWGENGYFRIARGKNCCGIAEMVSYPILS